MLPFKNKEDYINNSINNELTIEFPLDDIDTITGENIESESMELTQAICDENGLKFGGCISSEFLVNVFNTSERTFDTSLVGKWIVARLNTKYISTVPLYPSNTLYPSDVLYPGYTEAEETIILFSGKIDSVKTDKNNRNMKTIKAYDLMATLHNWDVSNKIHEIYIHAGREQGSIDSTLEYLLIDNEIPYRRGKYFDEIFCVDGVEYTLGSLKIFSADWDYQRASPTIGSVLKYICEILGLFCVIIPTDTAQNGFLGVVSFIQLGKGEYIDVEPEEATEIYTFYENLYEDEGTIVGQYTDVMFDVQNKSSQALKHGYAITTAQEYPSKEYDLTENPFIWDETSAGNNSRLYSLVNSSGISSRFSQRVVPLELTVSGRPWVQIGDKIAVKVYQTNPDGSFVIDNKGDPTIDTIYSYILKRQLKGIIALTDYITIRGD